MKKLLPLFLCSASRRRAGSWSMRSLALAFTLGAFPIVGHAFVNVPDVFSGSNGALPTTVSATAGVLAGATQTQSIGPGFSATSTVPLGVIYTQSLEINNPTNSPNSLRIYGTGVAGIASSFSATRTLTGNTMDDFSTYQFALTKDPATQMNLLGSLRVVITVGSTTVFDTATQATSLLSSFGGSNVANYAFTTGNIDNVSPIVWTISGTSLATLLGQSMTFSSSSLMAAPEGSTLGLVTAGCALLMLRRRRSASRA